MQRELLVVARRPLSLGVTVGCCVCAVWRHAAVELFLLPFSRRGTLVMWWWSRHWQLLETLVGSAGQLVRLAGQECWTTWLN